ncbi:hypothetical protein [Enterobacillus tribolii]|uniref:Uncharacterized protein n=1 Tax=Enterobacillus tribolii TaxID=1487935 RepID=A0A370QHG0_9GAMM|nr:hypothetical protein [Enterobacillus tribolii]RDK87530.1 hypothetical protein C8D90_109125 [Enterobacillus tribolii]
MKTIVITALMALTLTGSAFAQTFSQMTPSEQRATVVNQLNNGSAQAHQIGLNK